ncbi:5-(carboxyamino)imidazole ribonucleotide synthase [Alteribacter keqinensis]|uniref:N5-carboxyaminoimidazole ribonucleotide synthase n=1 Tax=Alteribacter keqinensis TaxID=2483800 RepID=A0A3M7TQU2_9BACI|nr:5-(carboxyamino)imidazole ribonucleotide synthase [Alteribacter keqinensis]RNA66720.1 5-(carboxyamino)imidazole ribonucleotide synthase [Alteribacter keqinensis]
MTRVLPGKTIGILGGGQLGRMMALSARQMGYRIAILEPGKGSPAGQVADTEVMTAYNDEKGAEELAQKTDVITYEFENIDANTASWLEENANFPQGSNLLAISQDRLKEKKAITSFGVPVAPYVEVNTIEELYAATGKLGYPSVLKTTRGGYDGKGQAVIQSPADLLEAWNALEGKGPFVLEKWIAFTKELSVIITRSVSGSTSVFPVAENVHKNNILHQTIVPARISGGVQAAAVALAEKLAESFGLVGTLAVELFLTEDDELYVNELAPRPHNSGHFTINACDTSQFEQHVRAVCDLPLGKTDLLKPAVMVNILGEHVPRILEKMDDFPEGHLHLYGKESAKPGRKMGHLTLLGDNTEEILRRINSSAIWREQQVMEANQ